MHATFDRCDDLEASRFFCEQSMFIIKSLVHLARENITGNSHQSYIDD